MVSQGKNAKKVPSFKVAGLRAWFRCHVALILYYLFILFLIYLSKATRPAKTQIMVMRAVWPDLKTQNGQ